ncbi:MAG: AAA family ATPase [Bacilli bacterium]|nr:AAA family ATPase [Bacilli bacterium]
MYLKEIQATGFKSFADKLTINLDNKTTCIVGPNGSGKSNIVDAVRWVLGEQSVKSLRGDNGMTDVIFTGSNSRNPLNVASVSLTFDNSDNYLNIPYNEVVVKRRVYRSGENEYFLNGEKCRLKDITDLFIDSGIGRDSFNIISQGEVDRILSNSVSDRRAIFEEAAGVLKYKKRKEEAIRKLDRTRDNMNRVDDIIAELEVQVEPLKEQSRQALEYIENKEKLEDVEVALIASEIERINYICENDKKRVEELNNNILNLNIKNNRDDSELIDKKNELSKISLEVNELNNNLVSLIRKEEQLNGEKNLLKERSKYQAGDQKIHENIANLKENSMRISNDVYLKEKDYEILKNNYNEQSSIIDKLDMELSSLKNKYSNILSESGYKRRDLVDLNHKIEVLTNNIENGGNLNSSVKAVLNNPRLSGIHQVLGNIVSCDNSYTKALEVALLSSKQYVVVDNENSAKHAINYLKDNNLGRATFFPLNVVKPRGVDPEIVSSICNDEGYINIFINVVEYESIYHSVVSNQLGNVILVKDLDSANRISRKINNRYKIVTLDGEVINVGGSITGGSLKITRSVISDKRDLDLCLLQKNEINSLIVELDKQVEEYNDLIHSKEEDIYKEKTKLVSIEEKIRTNKNDIILLKGELESVESELNSLGHVVDSSLSKEEERIMSLFYEVSRDKEELQKSISVKVSEKDKLSSLIDEMEAINKINNSELYKYEKELKELEISISKNDVKLDNYLNTLNEEYELTYEKARDNYSLEVSVEEARSLVSTYKNNIKRLGMVNLAAIDEYKRVSERYEFLTSQRNDLVNAKETLLEIIDEMDDVMKSEFTKTFKLVDEEFRKVFKELFKGGSAHLKLTDPNNVLETDIEISACPPGKKLKTLSLLSGGEKTLTAISLIFAILNVRTVPFCLFDEVEAALDEANVDNFGTYLNHYKDKTQFLIITHKKKTMEYADTLYGITMQESGVSKLVSVKLDQIDVK